MTKLSWTCCCLAVCFLTGCGNTPKPGPEEPAPKTEAVTKPDGSTETTTTVPTPPGQK
jgi:hypothetical protein